METAGRELSQQAQLGALIGDMDEGGKQDRKKRRGTHDPILVLPAPPGQALVTPASA